MTGPEHYQRAQQIVGELEASAPHTPAEWHAARCAQAQVHATLALAAATVDARRGGTAVWEQWPQPTLPDDPNDPWGAKP